jgi:hypothetical protein
VVHDSIKRSLLEATPFRTSRVRRSHPSGSKWYQSHVNMFSWSHSRRSRKIWVFIDPDKKRVQILSLFTKTNTCPSWDLSWATKTMHDDTVKNGDFSCLRRLFDNRDVNHPFQFDLDTEEVHDSCPQSHTVIPRYKPAFDILRDVCFKDTGRFCLRSLLANSPARAGSNCRLFIAVCTRPWTYPGSRLRSAHSDSVGSSDESAAQRSLFSLRPRHWVRDKL